MGLFLFLMIAAENANKKINWYPSFAVKHKMPYGSYIVHQEAKKLFGNKMKNVRNTPYVYLSKNPNAHGTYVFYNDRINFGETNLKKLLEWTKKGNDLFISNTRFEASIEDSLGIKMKFFLSAEFADKTILGLLNRNIKPKDSIIFDKTRTRYVFKSFDTINSTVLGYFGAEKDSLYNFIKLKYGKGNIFLHSFPHAFTNYFMLENDNATYTSGLLSYINRKQNIYWDTNYKNGATSKGILKYIAANPAFLWAYRLIFIGLFLYIIFEGKRKQRPIPVVEPLKNETLVFTKTVADMYLENKEHKRIALLHINHLMDYIRTHLYLDTRKWDREFMEKVAEKSKTSFENVRKLFELIDEISGYESIRPEKVLELEKLINLIKK